MVFAVLGSLALATASQEAPDPYQVKTVCTAMPVNAGRRLPVANGAELQQALDTAAAGDTILLTPGASFVPPPPEGSFVLRNRVIPEGRWVVVRSAHAAFEAGGALQPGTRVDEAHAASMPQIRSTGANRPAIRAEPGAHGYRLVGLDVGALPSATQLTNMIELGTGAEPSIDLQPHDIIVDRSFVHGNDAGNFRRGVLLNGRNLAVIHSRIANFHDTGGDSQAVGGSHGAGPIKILDNHLEAASETIIFGGSDPTIEGLVPSDIEIRRNLMTKRLAWQSDGVVVKNAFELKNARRVLVEGNVFEHVWVSGQDGTAILLKSVNQDGRCSWCVTEYVTFRRNIVRGAAHGVTINAVEVGRRGIEAPIAANHLRFEDVLFEDLGAARWGGGGKLFRVYGGAADVSITHVTSLANASSILEAKDRDDSNPRFVFAYNIVERRSYGIGAGSDEGMRTLTRNFAPFTYAKNVLVNTSADGEQPASAAALESRYPPSTWVAGGWADLGFMPGTPTLAKGSRYAGAADDGRDVGASMAAITAAQEAPARDSEGCGQVAVPRRQ